MNGREDIYSTQAYIIKNSSAKNLIKKIYNNNKFYLTEYKDKHTADGYIFNVLKTYCYKYAYFTYLSDNNSTIHDSHLEFHKKSKNNIILQWENKIKQENFNDKDNIKNSADRFYYNLLLIGIIIIIITLIPHLNYQI